MPPESLPGGSAQGAPTSTGQTLRATAYWTATPGVGLLREVTLDPPGPGEALIRTLHSGISRGTELLVHRGQVPASIAQQLRAPFQEGDFPGPVKYGYLSVGVVEAGPAELTGRRVFCLFPHQDRYVAPVSALTVIPDDVPTERAVLAGAAETALNAIWDGGPRLGDRVAVIGAGMIGGAVAALLRRHPLDRLQLIDVDPSRAAVAARLGVAFRHPEEADGECDLVFHCSATAAGLNAGLRLLGDEAELIELSWYGTGQVQVELGSAFHARRLRVLASQVSAVSAARRARCSPARRRAMALDLLRDARFDALLGHRVPFTELPEVFDRLHHAEYGGTCTVVDYGSLP